MAISFLKESMMMGKVDTEKVKHSPNFAKRSSKGLHIGESNLTSETMTEEIIKLSPQKRKQSECK